MRDLPFLEMAITLTVSCMGGAEGNGSEGMVVKA